MPLGLEIPRSEVIRYLGFRIKDADTSSLDDEIDACIKELGDKVNPGFVWKEYDMGIDVSGAVPQIKVADFGIRSKNLAKNLEGCKKAILFAATIGPEADRLVRRAEIRSATTAAIYQAAGAAAIEALCDFENDKLKDIYERKAMNLKPRFSPGYGDVKLEHQKDWFRCLDITKRIGVELTDSFLMVPTKSVTAIIGITSSLAHHDNKNCKDCTINKTCEFSRYGK